MAGRDPWVFPDPDGDGWHMLITARANHGVPDDRGVIGHARSTDLYTWSAQPPLSQPGAGFGHLEVPQVAEIDGRVLLIFSCLADEYAAWRKKMGVSAGVWAVAADSPLGPFDVAAAHPLTSATFYAGRIARDRRGQPVLMPSTTRTTADSSATPPTPSIPVVWSSETTLATVGLKTRSHPTKPAR